MKRRYEILSQHPYEIVFNEKRGRWFTRFKVNGKYVQRHRDTRAELEDLVINFYQTRSTCTGDVHPEEEEEVQKEKKLPKVSRKPAPVIPKKIPRDNPKSRERLIKELQIEAEKAAEEEADDNGGLGGVFGKMGIDLGNLGGLAESVLKTIGLAGKSVK